MAARRFFVGGNHKCYGSKQNVATIIDNLAKGGLPSDVEVVIAPPALYTVQAVTTKPAGVEIAVQNCYKVPQGAFTGELSPAQIKDCGVKWIILGHSERRHVFMEPDDFIAEKVLHALDEGVGVIFCIGEKLDERKADKTKEVCYRQMQAVVDKGIKSWDNVVIAYEPVWAIGTGVTASPEQAEEAHQWCRDWLKNKVSADVANKTRIIYGGSVTKDNCKELGKKPNVDGFLVGGASLKPDFIDICKAKV